MTDPFVALMRRYVIDYTNSHDLAVCDEIMEPDYVVHISGMSLLRDRAYKPAVAMVFARFPGLCLAIHEIVTNGERLTMRFAEHGADSEGRLCCWRGIALYRWNGRKLTECRVEQDFLSQQRQIATGLADRLEAPHLDPWTTTRAEAADPIAERIVAQWLRAGDVSAAPAGAIDDGDVASFEPVVEARRADVLDVFSAGNRVAFHASLTGPYVGGLSDVDEHRGEEARLDVAGIATVVDGAIARVHVVTDRFGTASRLAGRPLG